MVDEPMCEGCLLSKLAWFRDVAPLHRSRYHGTQRKGDSCISGVKTIYGGTENTVYEVEELVLDKIRGEESHLLFIGDYNPQFNLKGKTA